MKILIKPLIILQAVICLQACTNKSKDNTLSKPNVIIMLVDDAGYADFGFAGSKDLKTPNIDKLANNGIIFTDAHVTASVCGPSRAGIMTGRYQQRFGFECNPSHAFTGIDLKETTIADAMKQVGYKTAAFGKWHLGDGEAYKPNARGFDYYYGFLSGGRSYFSNEEEDCPGDVRSIRENDLFTTFNGYLTDRLGDKAVEFIDRNKENPFFMYWAPNAVHTPMEATQEDLDLFKGHPRQNLAAMTWALDRAVGQIVDKLKKEKLLDNTLIFFLSDNGGSHFNQSRNYPLKGFKGNKYEGGIRVNFFMHWPKELQKGKFEGLTSSLDIFATSTAISGEKIQTYKPLDGVNLLPYLKNEKSGNPHEELFWRKDKMAAMRKDDFKMIHVDSLGYRLYDLKNDISESKDLTVAKSEKLNEMKERISSWERQLVIPLWTENQAWNIVTWMIHEDLYYNRKIRVSDPMELKEWKNID